jgi:hypothetical protein
MGSLPTRTCGPEGSSARKIALFMVALGAIVSAAGGTTRTRVTTVAPTIDPGSDLCKPDAAVLATCTIRRKLVSVCGHGHRSTYRFGRPDRIELEASSMDYVSQFFAGGGESQIVITRGAYQYVIYDSATRGDWDDEGHNPLIFSSGLMVLRHGRHLSDIACNPLDWDIVDTNAVSNYMPKGEYVWHKGMQ